jgi:hypothetical protein
MNVTTSPPPANADVTPATASTSAPSTGDECPLCGAPLHSEQEWCLRCGAAARTRLAAAPNWRAPITALTVVVVLSLGVLAGALVKLAGSSSSTATASTIVTTPAATPTPSAAAPTTLQPAPTGPSGAVPGNAGPASTVPGAVASGTVPRVGTTGLPRTPTSPAGVNTPQPNFGNLSPSAQARLRELRARSERGK